MDTKPLGVELGKARIGENIPQDYMAKKSGYSQTFISLVEKGEREAPVKLVHIYADETGREDLRMKAFGIGIPDLSIIIEKSVRYDLAMKMIRT